MMPSFRARSLAGLALILAELSTFAARAATFSIEDVLSAPYPTALVAAEEAGRIAWVMNEQGVRNLWTAAAPDFTPRRLSDYEADDGQALGGLALSRDGAVLVYVRGGGPNAAGEIPNPAHLPEGAERALWAVRTDGSGEPWKVADGGSGVWAADGRSVFQVRGGQVFRLPIAPPDDEPAAPVPRDDVGDPPPRLTAAVPTAAPSSPSASAPAAPLFKTRGGVVGLVVSPDGRRLAFSSSRGDHGFVGVFELAARRLTWMAPSVDRDTHPAFSPDGRRIAFVRRPGRKMGELQNLTAGEPFALWVGDVATGEAREVWSSPGADGGFAQGYFSRPLLWAADDRLVFTSEHEGWIHVYGLPAGGGEALDLTPGAGEVESFVLSADGTTLYFAGNRLGSAGEAADVDRRHLWRVPSAGGEPLALTPGDGIETDPVVVAEGWLAFRDAGPRRPTAVSVLELGTGERQRVAPGELPASFPGDELVTPRQVVLTAADGVEVHGQLFLPADASPGERRPAVIFLHGGPIRQMLLGWHYRGYYANAYALNQYLASRGYVVLALNFRTGIGYGRAFRQAAEQGPRGASEYRDVLAAGRYLQGLPEVDGERIGLWGGSYGGYLTALGLARHSELFAAGVDLHGVHDWSYRGRSFPAPGGAWGLQGEELLELARRSSPVAELGYWSSPVLFIHGDDDRNVLFIQTTDLVQRLRQRDVHVETLVFPDEVHGFLLHASWLRAFRATADFFDRFLGGGG